MKWGLILVAVVFVLTACFRTSDALLMLDRFFYAQAMELSASRTWVIFWEAVSFLGSGWFVYFWIGLALIWRVFRRRNGITLGLTLLSVLLFFANTIMKLFFALERPVSLSPFSELTTYTFPSGHSFNAVLFAFFFRDLLRDVSGKLPWTIPVAAVYVFMIGFSRVLLGAHWFSDVIGGWTLGGLITVLLMRLWRRREISKK